MTTNLDADIPILPISEVTEILNDEDCPPVSILIPCYKRRKFISLILTWVSLHQHRCSSYIHITTIELQGYDAVINIKDTKHVVYSQRNILILWEVSSLRDKEAIKVKVSR